MMNGADAGPFMPMDAEPRSANRGAAFNASADAGADSGAVVGADASARAKALTKSSPAPKPIADIMPSITPCIRLAYTSRSLAVPAQREAQARAVAAQASEHNAQHGITGLLALVSGRYLQILEGPGPAVEALFARIRVDPRHTDVSLLLAAPIDVPMFSEWSMGLVDRTEAADITAARALALQQRLVEAHEMSVPDLLRWMFAPSANPPSERANKRQDSITRIAFASAGGLWNAAVLQHLAADKHVRVGRSQVADAQRPDARALLEYADLDVAQVGTVRALSLSRDPTTCPLVAPLLEQLSLLVFLLGSSELEEFVPFFCGWVQLPQVQAARPRVLLLTSLSAERGQAMLQGLRGHTDLPISMLKVKLSEPAQVWQATCDALPKSEQAGPAASSVAPLPTSVVAPSPAPAPAPAALATAAAPSAPTAPTAPTKAARTNKAAVGAKKSKDKTPAAANVALQQALADSACLQELMLMDGATQAAVLCTQPPQVLLHQGLQGPDALAEEDVAQMLDHAQFLRAKQGLVARLSQDDSAEEISIVTRHKLHLFRPLRQHPAVFLAITLQRDGVLLGAARLRLQEVEEALGLV
jgi:Sensors of blue-light using FAD